VGRLSYWFCNMNTPPGEVAWEQKWAWLGSLMIVGRQIVILSDREKICHCKGSAKVTEETGDVRFSEGRC